MSQEDCLRAGCCSDGADGKDERRRRRLNNVRLLFSTSVIFTLNEDILSRVARELMEQNAPNLQNHLLILNEAHAQKAEVR